MNPLGRLKRLAVAKTQRGRSIYGLRPETEATPTKDENGRQRFKQLEVPSRQLGVNRPHYKMHTLKQSIECCQTFALPPKNRPVCAPEHNAGEAMAVHRVLDNNVNNAQESLNRQQRAPSKVAECQTSTQAGQF